MLLVLYCITHTHPQAAAFPLFELRPRGCGSSMAGSLAASLDEEQGGVVDTGGQEMQRT